MGEAPCQKTPPSKELRPSSAGDRGQRVPERTDQKEVSRYGTPIGAESGGHEAFPSRERSAVGTDPFRFPFGPQQGGSAHSSSFRRDPRRASGLGFGDLRGGTGKRSPSLVFGKAAFFEKPGGTGTDPFS